MRSREWAQVKDRYRKSKLSQKCYACKTKVGLHLHHRTYERLGRENLRDLQPLCDVCHHATHEFLRRNPNVGLWGAAYAWRQKCFRELGEQNPNLRKNAAAPWPTVQIQCIGRRYLRSTLP